MRRREIIGLIGSAVATCLWPLSAVAQQPAGGRGRHPLSLTSAQQAEIWRGLGKEAMKTLVPAGLHIGEVVPNTMHLLPFARDLRKKLPMIRPYLYALLHGQVLIIDPRTRKIVSIVVE